MPRQNSGLEERDMPAISIPYTKNVIRRAFDELADPSPSRKELLRVWQFFDSCCAYCGKLLQPNAKEGHLDHLVAAAQGGANALGNRVLSCAHCNEHEKRDQPWETFLGSKDLPTEEFEARRKRILDWQTLNPLPDGAATHQIKELARRKAREITDAFDAAVADVRQAKKAVPS